MFCGKYVDQYLQFPSVATIVCVLVDVGVYSLYVLACA